MSQLDAQSEMLYGALGAEIHALIARATNETTHGTPVVSMNQAGDGKTMADAQLNMAWPRLPCIHGTDDEPCHVSVHAWTTRAACTGGAAVTSARVTCSADHWLPTAMTCGADKIDSVNVLYAFGMLFNSQHPDAMLAQRLGPELAGQIIAAVAAPPVPAPVPAPAEPAPSTEPPAEPAPIDPTPADAAKARKRAKPAAPAPSKPAARKTYVPVAQRKPASKPAASSKRSAADLEDDAPLSPLSEAEAVHASDDEPDDAAPPLTPMPMLARPEPPADTLSAIEFCRIVRSVVDANPSAEHAAIMLFGAFADHTVALDHVVMACSLHPRLNANRRAQAVLLACAQVPQGIDRLSAVARVLAPPPK
jgi:hypothetical protein